MTHETQARIAALVTAGFIAATAATAAGAAYADTATSGNGSIGGGNQLIADLDVPVNVCGNAIAILGLAGAQCTDSGASVTDSSSVRGPQGGYEEPEESEGETPGGESPEGETPGGESPEGETPGGEKPEGETPGGETPGGGDPGEESSEGETPGQEVPEDREGLSEESPAPVDEQAAPGHPGSSSAEAPGQQTSEQLSWPSSEQPPASELAVTGTDSTGLLGMVAAAAAAVAAGIGLVVAGKRRRARV